MKRWLKFAFGVAVASGIWLSLYLKNLDKNNDCECYLKYLPLICVFVFGIYSLTVVIYRTFTFNNCEEAYEELLDEIKMARKDLIKKGVLFDKNFKSVKKD
ncbi:dolichol-phosphate mannosyltransferase subunit 3 [Trichogramma pretiosum]|uniref:dolichol-phosphate mannosyltransferase subunit 3 n=1 Tax=Trichogramma pretiosum TaxID=7493 RepID=UPI0006C9C74D|nr:dolichol-phosphate mannosyltransferase subunit 3 [Trichogramma pretiosum]